MLKCATACSNVPGINVLNFWSPSRFLKRFTSLKDLLLNVTVKNFMLSKEKGFYTKLESQLMADGGDPSLKGL